MTEHLVIAHLFPDLLNLYGDRGNVRMIEQRAQWRGMTTEVRRIGIDDSRKLLDVDVVVVGGGPDQAQVRVARALRQVAGPLTEAIGQGASLLAVCAGYQNLGHRYHSALAGDLAGPGLFDAWTEASSDGDRIEGGVVVELPADSPIRVLGQASATAAGHRDAAGELTGFENHSGRTHLGPSARALGVVRTGRRRGVDASEGAIAYPGDGGLAGVRIGTYLHGPVLARNPHLADYLTLSALRRRGITGLPELDDRAEWEAHVAFADGWRRRRRPDERVSALRRRLGLEALENLLGPRT